MMPGVRVGLHIVIGRGVQSDRHAEGSSGETDRKGREFMDVFTLDWPLYVVGYPPVVLEVWWCQCVCESERQNKNRARTQNVLLMFQRKCNNENFYHPSDALPLALLGHR